MANSYEKEKQRLVQEKCQSIIGALLKDEDNKYCVDCDAKSPRWASWNLGIFLCIRCAGIHRNLGVHISKVKSVNLDSWTPQQVACIQQMGNSRARAVYEANQGDNFRRPQTDSTLEQFIRAKYEAKKYIAKEWVEPPMPNPSWEADVEKQLKKKREKKSPGKIEFQSTTKTIPKSNGVSPKPLPKAPGGKSSPGHAQARRTSSGSSNTSAAKGKNETPSKINAVSQNTQDLLGLEISPSQTASVSPENSDPFGEFLSAPISTSNNIGPNITPVTNAQLNTINQGNQKLLSPNSVEADESSFFNQTAPAVKSNEKLSKDSIMALYAKGQPPQMFGANGMQQYGSVSPGFIQNPSGGVHPVQNMIPGMQQQQPRIQQTIVGNTMGPIISTPPHRAHPPAHNPTMTPQNMMSFQHMSPNLSSTGSGSYSTMMAPGIQLSPANPFSQMHSQMSGINLGGMSGIVPPAPGMMTSPQPGMGVGGVGGVNLMGNQMGMRPTMTTPGFSPMSNHNSSTLSANLWQ